jgi:predicted nuclease of predicted toxin-antitoxin system
VRFFFDNNISPHLAHAVRELCKVENNVEEVIHLRDRFSANTKDHEWITNLAKSGPWVVISQDTFIKNDLEREALRQSGLIVFVLDRQWSQHKHWPKSQNLVKWWPAIMEQSLRIKGGASYRVSWRYSGGRVEQIRL